MENAKVVVVTGGCSIGPAIAERLAAHDVKAVVALECRSSLSMVEPSIIGLSKKERRDLDKQHWKDAKRYGKQLRS